MTKAIQWTEAHGPEAHRALYRLAAERRPHEAQWMTGGHLASTSERHFRDALASVGRPDPISEAEADRIVRRVNGLATGRLVRETVWAVRAESETLYQEIPAGETKARMVADQTGRRVVRVTRVKVAK